MTGTLYGIGVGPGDPELMTLKAVATLANCDVVAYHAAPGKPSTALAIATPHLPAEILHLPLHYPVTTGSTDHPGGYAGALAEFYAGATSALRQHLDAGRNVALIALGDPLLYSSQQHLQQALADDYPTVTIPGISAPQAAASELGRALAQGTEELAIIPATTDENELFRRLDATDTAVVMKVGRLLPTVYTALQRAGKLDRAYLVVRASMADGYTAKLTDLTPEQLRRAPYFSVVVVPTARTMAIQGQSPASVAPAGTPSDVGDVVVVGLGPGPAEWQTPQATAELAAATDIIGYSTYVKRVSLTEGQTAHASDNRVEAERAEFALDLARHGKRVAVVSSGDAGVFAMAAAVLEVASDGQWDDIPVRIVPGMTAAQAVSSRVGAPLGHDFAMISLSNRLKPWEVIVRRLHAIGAADMAVAIYNPASTERTWQVDELRDIMLTHRAPTTPVVVARAVGSAQEKVQVIDLSELTGSMVDMRTMLIIGASTTQRYTAGEVTRVFTSRYYAEPTTS